jgi:predicted N-acetyltransferase YhbS
MAVTDTATSVKIRNMEPEDIESILEIDRKISGMRRTITYRDLITGDLGGELDLSFIAETDGNITGFILARRSYIGDPITETGLIQILGVEPDFQARGIATGLVNAVMEKCRERHLRTVKVMANERDSELSRLFSHLGFHRGRLVEFTRVC